MCERERKREMMKGERDGESYENEFVVNVDECVDMLSARKK